MSAIDQAHFRSVLGRFPTGVTVVAGIDPDGDPVGLAIGSFFSISLDPALVGFCVGAGSSSWPKIAHGGAFCVNILGADQEEVCATFASKVVDKFADLDWDKTDTGSPRITGSLAWIDCELDATYVAGDHEIVVGRVEALEARPDGNPLVFLGGRFAHLAP